MSATEKMTQDVGPTHRNEVEATQATKRPGLIYVLAGGLALVLIGFAIVWLSQGQ